MPKINYWAVGVAAVAAFAMASLWYSPLLFGKLWMELRGLDPTAMAGMKMSAGKVLGEFGRELAVTYVLARFVALLGAVDWKRAVSLGLWAWIGFPATLLAGSILWDNVPWKLAAIHGGDWLVKMLLITSTLGLWRRGEPQSSDTFYPFGAERTAISDPNHHQ